MKNIRRKRLNDLLKSPRFNGDRSAFLSSSGITKGRLTQLLNPNEPFGDTAARNLCESLGLPDGWFDSGAETAAMKAAFYGINPSAAKVAARVGVPIQDSEQNQPLALIEPARAAINLIDNPDFPAIRRVNIKLSAGASGFGIDYVEEDEAPIVFQRKWFERNGYIPTKLLAVRVANGSMEPGLYDGDTVVINTADETPKDGEVFAVNYEGELVIKRMVRDAGQWWLASDNPDQRRYPRKVCGEGVYCLGRVVHKQSERI